MPSRNQDQSFDKDIPKEYVIRSRCQDAGLFDQKNVFKHKGDGLHILLAEDDLNIQKLTRITMESLGGHIVDVASDGQEAFDKIMSKKYDLVLIDDKMPAITGREVCRKYFEQRGLVDKPIFILFSATRIGHSPPPYIAGFISKPFTPATLNSVIEKIIKKHKEKIKKKLEAHRVEPLFSQKKQKIG